MIKDTAAAYDAACRAARKTYDHDIRVLEANTRAARAKINRRYTDAMHTAAARLKERQQP